MKICELNGVKVNVEPIIGMKRLNFCMSKNAYCYSLNTKHWNDKSSCSGMRKYECFQWRWMGEKYMHNNKPTNSGR